MSNEESKPSGIINAIGIALIVISYTGALLNMLNTKRIEAFGDKKVVRICHWQLESGFREGLDYAIKEFEKLNPDVKIIQLPIYQRAFTQFVRTQLIGGTAPDLIEIDLLGSASAMKMAGRYFYPLTREVYKPNEYNADNDFKDVPWLYTFKDGLQGAVNVSDLEYYSAGLNNFSTRLFYNKTLLKKVLGIDTLPADYRSFLAMCDSIMSYAKQQGKTLLPIAGANYQTGYVRNAYYSALTPEYYFIVDKNGDGLSPNYTKFYAYLEGKFSFSDPQIRAAEEISRAFAKYYQPGFMAQDRMESGFAFAQQRAVIISSGSWDFQSLALQAHENGFEIGVARFPMPQTDDPEYGKYVKGDMYEASWTAGRFGITRASKHPEVALKFLKFITSVKMNSKINDIIGWMPAVRNAAVRDELKPFELRQHGNPGISSPLSIVGNYGGKTFSDDAKAYWEYISGTTGYDGFVRQIEKRFVVDGMADVYLDLLSQRDQTKQNDHDRSYYSAMMVVSSGAANRQESLTKLLAMTSTFQANSFGIADRGYGLWKASQLKNDRVARLAEATEYGLMEKSFGFEKQ